ncbi:MAG: AI-2E family transporter [Chloroflexota bacterium]
MSEQQIIDEHPSPRWNGTTKLLVSLFAVILIGLAIWQFETFIPPLVVAVMIAYLLNPAITFLVARFKFSRGLAVGLIYFVLLVLLFASATGIGIYAVNQISTLNVDLQQIVQDLPRRAEEMSRSRFELTGYRVDLSTFDFNPLYRQLLAAAQPMASRAGGMMGSLLSSVGSFFGWGSIVLVISFYIVKDMPQLGDAIHRFASDPGYHHDVQRLLRELDQIWNTFLRGQSMLALIMFVETWLLLTILGTNYSFALGLFAGFMEFIPFFGPYIVLILITLVALFQTTNWIGLTPLAYAIVVFVVLYIIQSIELYVVVPRIIGGTLKLHPAMIIIGAIMGVSIGGILGVLLAAPVMASLRLFARYMWCKLLDLDPFSVDESPPKLPSPSLLSKFFKRP